MTKAPWIPNDPERKVAILWKQSETLQIRDNTFDSVSYKIKTTDETQITKARLLLDAESTTQEEAESLSAFLQGENVDVSSILERH